MGALSSPKSALKVSRLDAGAWAACLHSSTPPLGGLVYGAALAAAAVPAQRLSPADAWVDAWQGGSDLVQGRCGRVCWRHDGQWLFGTVDLDEGADAGVLARQAQLAYGDVFATLRETGFDHLLRLWNYLPHINAVEVGLERYRQFNIGRQAAFLEAGYAAFEGAPAASALGTAHGPVRLRLLAGKTAPISIENPRQVAAYHYPQSYGPRSPTFSRAALVSTAPGEVTLFISGTASIVGHASVHAGDIGAQTRETVANLAAVIEAANLRCSGPFDLARLDCVVYVRRPHDLPAIRAALEACMGPASSTMQRAIFLQADICRADLLVEIEAHATAAGEVHRS